MKRPAIISVCCVLLADMTVAESVEVGTAKAEESSRNVRITVVFNGKPLKLATVEFCTTIGRADLLHGSHRRNGVAVPHVLALTTYHVCALFEDDLSSDLYLHVSPQGQSNIVCDGLDPDLSRQLKQL